MNERGKALDTYSLDKFAEFSYSTSEMSCKKHPSSSSSGICALCLKEKLANLVCSECGEQRLSSCSCSDVSSYRNSCVGEVGSVGRISSFIENEMPKKSDKSGEVILLRRSSSSCVEIKRSRNGFWKIKRLFRRKTEKGSEKDYVKGVSRSRSLCSFRGGRLNDADESSDYAFSSAKISDVTGGILFDHFDVDQPRKSGFRGFSDAGSEPRKSGFRGMLDIESESRKSGFRGLYDVENDPRRSSGFRGLFDIENEPRRLSGYRGSNSENEARKSGFRGIVDSENGKKSGVSELNRVNSVPNRSVFPAKESDFSRMDESAFIDLKLDLSSESKREFSLARISAASASDHDGNVNEYGVGAGAGVGGEGGGGASLTNRKNNGLSSSGGSCRITLNEKEIKSGSKTHKIWKWIFRQNLGRRNANKKNENNIVKY